MKTLLSKEYLKRYKLNNVIKSVHWLFEDYRSKKLLMGCYMEVGISDYRNETLTRVKKISNPVLVATMKREQLVAEIDSFNQTLKLLKKNLTEDELLIFRYCIEDKKTEYELCDLLHCSEKTVRWIKKSCYIKIALGFGLIDVT